ncbi:hypothetical protein VR46_44585, partial [Streptomyces sp. NRRL S-444]
LCEATGLKLPATLIFDYPNPETLARHLYRELLPESNAIDFEVDEERLRHALASLPLARFRAAGLMDALVKLVALGDGESEIGSIEEADEEVAIAEMGVDDLVQMALGD